MVARSIDDQLCEWSLFVKAGEHPALRHFHLADQIVADCTPSAYSPEDIVARRQFKAHLTEAVKATQLQKEIRRQLVSTLVQHDETDAEAISNPSFFQAFEIAESYIAQYQTSLGYPLALAYMKRLFIVREQLSPLRTSRNNPVDTEVRDDFKLVIRRLIEEL
ncbi:MAG: hypothetical protein WAR37_04135 [Candidatus Microsaccharimonas sp.]